MGDTIKQNKKARAPIYRQADLEAFESTFLTSIEIPFHFLLNSSIGEG